jgi:hypothetical protein
MIKEFGNEARRDIFYDHADPKAPEHAREPLA